MNYLLDACALIAVVLAENGSLSVKNLLDKAENGEFSIYMCKVNLLEVYYGVIRDSGVANAEELMRSIDASAIQVVNSLEHDAVFREAGRIKASYKLSLADAIALAYASSMNLTIVTADHHEMDIVEHNEDISFLWIR
jgi:predicted nucleic acid-binding protein